MHATWKYNLYINDILSLYRWIEQLQTLAIFCKHMKTTEHLCTFDRRRNRTYCELTVYLLNWADMKILKKTRPISALI